MLMVKVAPLALISLSTKFASGRWARSCRGARLDLCRRLGLVRLSAVPLLLPSHSPHGAGRAPSGLDARHLVPLVLVLLRVGSCRLCILPIAPREGATILRPLRIVRCCGSFRGIRARGRTGVAERICVLLLCPPLGQVQDDGVESTQ